MKSLVKIGCIALLSTLSACSSVSSVMNPFYEEPTGNALLGEANDHALNGGGASQNGPRKALEQMASYQRASAPQPVNPVMQPSVARLMWIPDHLNKNGDLVPAHYYYLKVLDDRWAVTDAFELESQLTTATPGVSNLPYVLEGQLETK